MAETWRAVVGFDDAYEVSDHGRVRSLPRVIRQLSRWGTPMDRRVGGFLLQPALVGSGGYLAVSLSTAGTQYLTRVGRIVLLAFVGEPPTADHQCAHGNGDRHDNRLGNLRWATPLENSGDRVLHGTHPAGAQNPAAKLDAATVYQIRETYRSGGVRQADLAALYSVGQAQIGRIVTGKSWKVDQ